MANIATYSSDIIISDECTLCQSVCVKHISCDYYD